jgi:hypothetical protein
VVADAIDLNDDGALNDNEILFAVALWIAGVAVPETDQVINDAIIIALVQMWIRGDPV